jgi:hypothetical protein
MWKMTIAQRKTLPWPMNLFAGGEGASRLSLREAL